MPCCTEWSVRAPPKLRHIMLSFESWNVVVVPCVGCEEIAASLHTFFLPWWQMSCREKKQCNHWSRQCSLINKTSNSLFINCQKNWLCCYYNKQTGDILCRHTKNSDDPTGQKSKKYRSLQRERENSMVVVEMEGVSEKGPSRDEPERRSKRFDVTETQAYRDLYANNLRMYGFLMKKVRILSWTLGLT